jgi:hypothetical protein
MSMHSDMDTLCLIFGGCTPMKEDTAPASASTSTRAEKSPSAPHKVKDHCSVIMKLPPGTADAAPEVYTAHTT